VVLVEPTGADTFLVLKTAVGLITARTTPHTPIKVGDKTGLDISDAHANWFDARSGLRIE
jgi:multiple sugar transport system ATP-binding protein